MEIELEKSEFRAVINDINQITVPKEFRTKFDINSKDEIILKLTGKVSKKEKRTVPVEKETKEEN